MEQIDNIVSDYTSKQLSSNPNGVEIAIGGLLVYAMVAFSGTIAASDDIVDLDGNSYKTLFLNNLGQEQLLLDDVNVGVETLAPYRAGENYDRMKASFESQFSTDGEEKEKYKDTFENLASNLMSLYIKNVYVDVSKISHNIDFCMNMGEKILLTVGMNAFDREDNDVMYAVYQAGELMVMNTCSLTELMEMATNMQNELNIEKCSKYTPIR